MKLYVYLLMWALAIYPIKVKQEFSKYHGHSEHALFENMPYSKIGSIPLLNRKIFMGRRVTIREHPYILSIRRKFAHYTVGVLLTPSLIISVAHPLLGVPVQELKIVEGENYADRGTSMNTVLLVIIHEQFDPYTLQADIALLRCHEYLTIRGSVKPIGLIEPGFDVSGYVALVTGWGRCDLTVNLPLFFPHIQDVELRPWDLCLPRSSVYFPNERLDPMLRSITFQMNPDNEHCDVYKQLENKIGPGMICAGPARSEDPMAPCMAVPGAALVIQGRLVALQSWGFGCGYSHDLPLIYTNVEYYQDWIANNAKILKRITKAQLSQFYQVTKTYELMEWLKLTRGDNVSCNIDQLALQTVKVDDLLARINGTVYDIRNFIFDRKFHSHKTYLYLRLRERYEKEILLNTLKMSLQYKLMPFLNRNNTKFSNVDIYDEDGGNEKRVADKNK